MQPTREDPVLASLAEVVGGPAGSRAGSHRWWTPVRVLLALTAVVLALGMVTKSPCASAQWQDSDGRYTAMCYSDLPYLYPGRGLSEQAWPYTSDPEVRGRFQVMEYPVGISYWAWATAHITDWVTGSDAADGAPAAPDEAAPEAAAADEAAAEAVTYVVVNALGFTLIALLTTWLLAGVNRRRAWDAAGFAVAPTLALTGLINWDVLALAFVAGALWAWVRDRPVLTGVMIGLGTAVKLYPLFLLGGVLVICLRRRQWGPLLVTTAATVGAWLLANAPAYLSGPEQWRVFWSFNSERGADLGSVWLVAQQAIGETIDVGTINLVSAVFFVLWCAGVLALGLAAPQTPRLAQLGFLVVAGFLLINKVYSPQYVLWLLPLAVLARPRWRELLLWQAAEILYFAAVWMYLGGYLAAGGGGNAVAYWVAILLRVAAQLFFVVLVARDVLRPQHDPARVDEVATQVQATTTRSNVVAV